MNTHHLDTSGLKCPMPIIKLQQFIRTLDHDAVIELKTTDPSAQKDVQSWCKVNRHKCLDITKQSDFLLIKIQICR